MKPSASAKLDMLDEQQRGQHGNFFKTYGPHLTMADARSKFYTLRNKERDSPYFVPVVRTEDLRATIQRLVKSGADINSIYVQEIPDPDSKRLIQGEIARVPDYVMHYSTHPTVNLRDALKRTEFSGTRSNVHGIMVKETILHYAGQQAWDDLEELLEKFPDRVAEFTVFDRPVGVWQRQMVTWEVRNY